ncbi:GNAT family N-acetyltransferase [Bacillus mycoides]|uniref:Ribosomal N-acetyltransferase YdaF n=1 Tax=Bacillus mycoides TaxID=1405 RepID=A0AAP8GTQ0_BACMY|nr:GNAT family protein [Bacillus mycoides]PJN51980.1 putative ribosomal N-acetyltransferase YdaF [Bacillus mycoides]PJN66939.1 putative ribosomal N-acetyltransferase YdaF [Bacillus mycoides]
MLIHKIDEEVSLRMFNEGDAEEFYNLIISSKSYLKEWLGWIDYIESPEDTVKNIKARLKEFMENGGYPKSFAIIYKGGIAGTIGFNDINKANKIGIVGYWLGENFQGKGIMTKALKTLIDYGFKELALNKIEISIAVENKKSRALPERFGFVEEGKLRQAEWLYDHYVDHVVYGLLAAEWK